MIKVRISNLLAYNIPGSLFNKSMLTHDCSMSNNLIAKMIVMIVAMMVEIVVRGFEKYFAVIQNIILSMAKNVTTYISTTLCSFIHLQDFFAFFKINGNGRNSRYRKMKPQIGVSKVFLVFRSCQ